MAENILELNNFSVSFHTSRGEVEAVRDINLEVKAGEIICIVGESGCGKTAMCQSIMHLLPRYAKIKSGEIKLDGRNITNLKEKEMRKIRGHDMTMVFQDPLTTLNPTIPVGKQIAETILKHEKVSKDEAWKRAVEMLALVRISNPEEMARLAPHCFSGGMRQRCVLAVALAAKPKLLFADEITTALDVTVAARVLDLLMDLRDKMKLSIVFISHDLGAVARIADRVAVMYAGRIVEIGSAQEIFYDPKHPYTWGLLSSLPALAMKRGSLDYIPGIPPSLINPPKGDAFAERNKYALAIDYEQMPPMFKVSDTHMAATWLLDERAPSVERPDLYRASVDELKEETEV